MNYEEFKADFMKENKKLKTVLFFAILIFSIGTASSLLSHRYYLYKGKEIFEERPLTEEVCLRSFLSITAGTPNPYLMTKGMFDLVTKEPFLLDVQKIMAVQSLEVGACKLIVKADQKLMAFKILLDQSNDNPFFYKLAQMDELGIQKEE